jgi:hypothetical protein
MFIRGQYKIYFLILILIPVINIDLFHNHMNEVEMDFKIYSPAFKDGEFIPAKYTCDGANISPPLVWTNPPENTKSFALICNDPDAPIGDWVHWILINIPPDARELKEESSSKHSLPKFTVEGFNDFRKNNYGGPCPPSGTHRYFFKLYALDTLLQLKGSTTKKQLLDAMKEDILAEATLMGKYKRQR